MSASAGRSDNRYAVSVHDALARVLHEHLGFVWGALTNVVTTTLAYFVAPYAQIAHLMIIHLVGAVLVSTRYGMVISTFTAVTGALAFDYFCIPPIFAFAMPEAHSVVIFGGMLSVALLVCWLNQDLRRQRAMARASETRTQSLCELSLDLSRVTSNAELTQRAERHLVRLFGSRSRLVLGRDPPATGRLQPVAVDERVFGYIQAEQDDVTGGRDAERRLLLAACADRVADAFKRLALGEAARRAQLDAELERNRNTLLSAVSHDMKTPLASILTAGTSLLSAHQPIQSDTSRELLETIVQEAERMNDLVTNLLSVTRLESGTATLNKELEALDDLIFGVLSRFSGRLTGRAVKVNVPRDLPLIPVDAVLVDQLLVNLLENVLRYTPAGSPVEIDVGIEHGNAVVAVRDRGPGFSPAERERVFDKFYRGQAAQRNDGGTGLGLTICRAVVRAHEGSITIAARRHGGAVVRFSLPCALPVNAARGLHDSNARRAHT